jgi:transcriptional regulator with XRE-family HTH domain
MTETFGEALRRLREAAGLSQPQLAKRVPISQASLSRYEHGRQAVDPRTADRLDELLNAGGALRAVLPADAVELALTADDRARVAHTLDHPSRIDRPAVSALGAVLAAQRRLDDALGPRLILPATMAQLATVTDLLRNAGGPHRDALAEVVAEYTQFAGWLNAEVRNDHQAVRLLTEAEQLADEVDNGTLAAQAANFKGWLARQQQRPRAVVRWFSAAHHTPGAHAAQRVGDAAQAAQGYADLGKRDEARRMLDVAGSLLDVAAREQPPGTAYWLTPTFHRLNIGLAHLSLGEHTDAADHIAAGLDGLPAEQQDAQWSVEYRQALDTARSAG